MRFPKHNNKDIAQNYNDIEFCRLIFSGYQRMIQRKKRSSFFLMKQNIFSEFPGKPERIVIGV